jgi:hypothetical protein
MDAYASDVEAKMRKFFTWLSEKDRRRYAAIEVTKLGHGGVEYIARLLGCDPKTIRQGLQDLDATDDPAADRVRKKGVGDHPGPSPNRPSWGTSSGCWRNSRPETRCGSGPCGPTCRCGNCSGG